MRAWGTGDGGGGGKSPPAREDKEEEAAGDNKKRKSEDKPEPEEAERGEKVAKVEGASAKDVDADLRAFFDGKAKQKGFREKKFGKVDDTPAVSKKEAPIENDPERAAAAAKDLELKIARAKRFGQ